MILTHMHTESAMKITHLEIRKLEIPFNVRFKHASAERSATESILVAAVTQVMVTVVRAAMLQSRALTLL